MIRINQTGITALNRLLKKTDYMLFMKEVRGIWDFQDPWYDFDNMKTAIIKNNPEYLNTFLLLQMGIPAEKELIEKEIGRDLLEGLFETGIWYEKDGKVDTDNFVVLCYQGIKVVVEVNPWFETCKNKHTDIYIGSDSLRLAETIPYDRGAKVLDLCSGSGIQGLLAARSAGKVVSVELNPKTVPVTRFNIALNGFEDKMEVREGDLYGVLREDEVFDYILANPPFIPMLDTVDYPICGTGGEDGLRVLRLILEGAPQHLSDRGEMIIFCECLGDENGVFFDKEVKQFIDENHMTCTVSQNGRCQGGYQIARLGELTALFNESFDRPEFEQKMQEVYSKLGAKYLYDLIYHLRKCDETGKITYIKLYNHWHTEDCLKRAEGITFKRDGGVFNAYDKEGRLMRQLTIQQAEELSYLCRDHNIQQTADWLYPRYSKLDAYRKYGYYSYVQHLLDLCSELERTKIIKKK